MEQQTEEQVRKKEEKKGSKQPQGEVNGTSDRGEMISAYLKRARNYHGKAILKHLVRCETCKEVFDSKIFKRHKSSCTSVDRKRYIYKTGAKIFKCQICGSQDGSIQSLKRLKAHLRGHSTEEIKQSKYIFEVRAFILNII